MADASNIDLTFLARQMETIIAAQRVQARENEDIRRLLLALVDQGQRFERRFSAVDARLSDIVPELDLMLKSDSVGRFAHLETQLDEKLAQMHDELVARFGATSPNS